MPTQAQERGEKPDTGKFDWMVGCWESLDGEEREVWSRAEAGIHFGYSVTLKGKAAGFFEHLRLELKDKARFVAYPNGMAPTAFEEEKATLLSASFVNPSHDYPQRIRYERKAGSMIAAISKMDGKEMRVFERRRCTDRSPLD